MGDRALALGGGDNAPANTPGWSSSGPLSSVTRFCAGRVGLLPKGRGPSGDRGSQGPAASCVTSHPKTLHVPGGDRRREREGRAQQLCLSLSFPDLGFCPGAAAVGDISEVVSLSATTSGTHEATSQGTLRPGSQLKPLPRETASQVQAAWGPAPLLVFK